VRIEILLHVRVVGKKRQHAVRHDDRQRTNAKKPFRVTLVWENPVLFDNNGAFLVRFSGRGEFFKLFIKCE